MIDTAQVATHYAGKGLAERLVEACFSGRPVGMQDLAPPRSRGHIRHESGVAAERQYQAARTLVRNATTLSSSNSA